MTKIKQSYMPSVRMPKSLNVKFQEEKSKTTLILFPSTPMNNNSS